VGTAALARVRLGSPAAYGVMLAALAVGGLAGALAAGARQVRRRGAQILTGAAVLSGCLMTLAVGARLWLIAGVLLVAGATAGLINVQIGAWVLKRIDAGLRGRVSSVLMLMSYGTVPVSMALAGWLGGFGLEGLFVLSAAALLLVAAGAALIREVRILRD
jgi:hypothetical protein